MKEYLRIFKALGDGSRLRIIKMLEVKPLCVCEITSILGLAPSTVSKHLSLLQEARLIRDTKDGKWVNYALSRDWDDRPAHEVLTLVGRWLRDDPDVLADKRKAEKVDRKEICA